MEKRENLPKYCKICGSLLRIKDAGVASNGFDEYTGKENKKGRRLYVVCPNDDSVVSGFDNGHTVITVIVED